MLPNNEEMALYNNIDVKYHITLNIYLLQPYIWKKIVGICKMYKKFQTAEAQAMKNYNKLKKAIGNNINPNSRKILFEQRDKVFKYQNYSQLFKNWCIRIFLI